MKIQPRVVSRSLGVLSFAHRPFARRLSNHAAFDRWTVVRLSLGCVSCALASPTFAQAPAASYPSKAIRVFVGFSPGSNSDSLARPMANRLSETIGHPVVVDNRPGASGNIALELVARSAPDGYAVFSGPGSSITTNPHMQEKMPIDVLRDLVPIVPMGQFSALLVVHPSMPVKSVGDLVALARRRPGAINYGSPGHGTGFHLATELFKVRAGIQATHVPYANASAMLGDLLSGRVDMMIFSAIVMAPHVKSGKLRALATTGRARADAMPNLPTIAEAGVADYEYTGFHGIFGPAALPREIVDRLSALIQKVLAMPDMREFYASQNVDPMVMTPAEFATRVRVENEKWGRLIREAGLKAGQ
ncbi:MAG: tripartite tricarboxylate transporter substrate binding protein [Proteobacteria bacterium]|nr:tripartite tricarboxylate transporter substrate binding protein [Burkholderiales bacterium]